ncbi:MAG: 50S ribosomal protein L39e [DPANN group archaeon]|nr:50S ribosomal protein L39e [DPANN group archaeon]
MATIKPSGRKRRLAKAGSQTRWAPFWVVPKRFGLKRARHIHPSRVTSKKRDWRRSRTKA